jgi:transposase
MLMQLKGIGPETAAILWSEGLFRVLRGDQDAKTASIRMRKCRRVCDGRGAYPD